MVSKDVWLIEMSFFISPWVCTLKGLKIIKIGNSTGVYYAAIQNETPPSQGLATHEPYRGSQSYGQRGVAVVMCALTRHSPYH